jgi:type IV pilus assembly protein PilW
MIRKGAYMAGNSRRQRGFSLIELMIAMLLGLLVVGAAGAVFLSNKRVYGTSETLGRIQENQRAAFEIMSRDLREAGGNPCSNSSVVVNQLKAGDPAANAWWASFAGGLRGYGGSQAAPGTTSAASGGSAGQRVQGTDAIDVDLANSPDDIRVTSHQTPSADLTVNTLGDIASGDILMVCNMDYAFIFQATDATGTTIKHAAGGGSTGNCTGSFEYERNCASATGIGYCLQVPDAAASYPSCDRFGTEPAIVSRVATSRWYIGFNDRGGKSLYRATVVNKTATATPDVVTPEEIAEGVSGMTLAYLNGGAWQSAADVADWSQVTAVRVQLTFEGAAGALQGQYIKGTDNNALSRTLTNVVALRNRETL